LPWWLVPVPKDVKVQAKRKSFKKKRKKLKIIQDL
jgi:hypothetical protein